MSKYTKGPWKWTAGYAMGPSDKDGTSCVQNAEGELVFSSCDGCSLEPSDADAKLIIAAPDLAGMLLWVFVNLMPEDREIEALLKKAGVL